MQRKFNKQLKKREVVIKNWSKEKTMENPLGKASEKITYKLQKKTK